MNIIVYYEGDDAVKTWLPHLLPANTSLSFRKLPTSNTSNEYTTLPAFVADILYLDKPDIILAATRDGVHEKPLFSIEIASCTPQYQHALQRFSRMLASVDGSCPAAIIIPARKVENSGGGRTYKRSQAIHYGAVRLMDVYQIPAFVFDWPDVNGILQEFPNSHLPALQGSGVQQLRNLLAQAITSFADVDYVGNLWRTQIVRELMEETRRVAYNGGQPSVAAPGGGGETNLNANLEMLPTSEVFRRITNTFPKATDFLKHVPDFISSRTSSLVFHPSRITAHAGDPYVGMVGYYDIAFCRNGRTTRDRVCNLVAFADSVPALEVTQAMKRFHGNSCPFGGTLKPATVVEYCYHLKHGCRETKIKPLRIYAELADVVVCSDAVLFNTG